MPPEQPKVNDPEAAKKKKQLTVIALLLAGLLIAIFTQSAGKAENASETTAKPVSSQAIDSEKQEGANDPREEMISVRELSRMNLDHILQTSLFYVPEPEPEPEEQVVEAQTPPEVKVQAIYGSGKLSENPKSMRHRVLMGRAIIRPGEVLPDGRQIVRVTPDGVELAQ